MVSGEKQDNKGESKTVKESDLTKFISVKVLIADENAIEDGENRYLNEFDMKVNVNDNVGKIVSAIEALEGSRAPIIFKSKLIKAPDDVTFKSIYACEGSQFL